VPAAPKLTTTSYVVLGLVSARQPITSYELKRCVAQSIGYFWPFPHSQLYAEPVRLVGLGLLADEVEQTGRKRRRYYITPAGSEMLSRWLTEPTTETTEIRDLGLLKLFFGSQARPDDLIALARQQQRAHRLRHDEYEALHTTVSGSITSWELATLDVGMRYEQMATEFWAEILVRAQRGVALA
jgi:PadR family transcriptional regulator AphA